MRRRDSCTEQKKGTVSQPSVGVFFFLFFFFSNQRQATEVAKATESSPLRPPLPPLHISTDLSTPGFLNHHRCCVPLSPVHSSQSTQCRRLATNGAFFRHIHQFTTIHAGLELLPARHIVPPSVPVNASNLPVSTANVLLAGSLHVFEMCATSPR